ncbi:hypothetical protein CEUSTIGMA_g6515.t1 [Chlamydomonas eustigma]|uniref:Uncharacterized protein n=1 Tax=Chlamydomonas eustigma TaxID=1157962 RepID=A0A250X7N7_9CHLO|nr:hypothetical protein CEUSTIGMA_g6515.t1 [Chlamydomonas eustigma]|eukprot:GAX79075.1 hypothetical protein CEUSTIGMA_g6515.t1 [Chlamydomonas eustigma]
MIVPNSQLGAFKHKATKKCIVKKNSKSDGFLAQHLFKKNIFTSLARGFPRSFVQKEGSLIPERHVARLENIAPESNQFGYYSKKLIAFIGLFLITCISLLRRYPAVFGIGSFALTTDSAVAACSNRIDENKQLQPPAAQTNHSVRHKASSALKSAFYLPARVLDFLVLNDHVVTPLLSGPRASSTELPTSAPAVPLTGEDSRDATSRVGKMEAAPSPTPLMTCQTESNGSASTSQTNLPAALPEAQISLSSSPAAHAQMLDSDLLVMSEDPEAGRSRMIDSTLAGAGALGLLPETQQHELLGGVTSEDPEAGRSRMIDSTLAGAGAQGLLPGTQQHELLGGGSLGEHQLHVEAAESAAAAFNKFNLSIEKAVPAEAWPAVLVHLLPSWSVEETYTLTWCGIVLGLLPIYQISLLLVLAATGGGRKSSTASEEPSTTSRLVSINPAEIAGGLQIGGINDNKTTFGAPSAVPSSSSSTSRTSRRSSRSSRRSSRRAEEERILALKLAEQLRSEEERIHAMQLAEQQRAEEERILAVQLTEQQRAEEERILAMQLVEQQRAEEERILAVQLAEQQRAEEERILTLQLVEQQRAEEERVLALQFAGQLKEEEDRMLRRERNRKSSQYSLLALMMIG